MANRLYDLYVQSYMTQEANQVDLAADDIRAILIDAASYTVNTATHEFLSDIPGGARVATVALTGETVTARVFDAADATFTAVSGATVEAVVLYKHTGVEATSRLIAYIDTATGLPVTPGGGDITVVWAATANKIFRL